MRDVRMRGFRSRTSVEDALALLASRTGALPAELVPVAECAGRVAAEDVRAAVSVPHFDRSAMDGYALRGEETLGASVDTPVEIAVVGDARPGRAYGASLLRAQAVRITTGAPIPAGADAVLMAEYAEEVSRDGVRIVRVSAAVAPGKHVGRIGEDVVEGAVVVTRGRKLRPQDAGVLASVGVAQVPVVRRPEVCILVTGDELLPPGSRPEGARIVDSNSLVLRALALRDGASRVRVAYVEDVRDAVREAIATSPEPVVLVSGGSSVGPEDHAPIALAEIGEVAVHGVAMRPSSPAGFGFVRVSRAERGGGAEGASGAGGASGAERAVFLLPGNPVSCLCAYEFFAGPTIRAAGGLSREWPHRRLTCTVASKIASEVGRTDYVRVKVEGSAVTPIMTSGASILSSTTRADGVVIVPAEREGYGEGEQALVLLYD